MQACPSIDRAREGFRFPMPPGRCTRTKREPLGGHDHDAIPKETLFRASFRQTPGGFLLQTRLPFFCTYVPFLSAFWFGRCTNTHVVLHPGAAVCRLKLSLVHFQRLGPGAGEKRPRKTRNERHIIGKYIQVTYLLRYQCQVCISIPSIHTSPPSPILGALINLSCWVVFRGPGNHGLVRRQRETAAIDAAVPMGPGGLPALDLLQATSSLYVIGS